MKHLNEMELITLAVTGNVAAFGELVTKHQLLIRNWLKKLSNDHGQADDLAQDTFVLAWKKLKDYRGEGEFKSWLLKIAYSTFLQNLRKQKSQTRLLERVESLETKENYQSDESSLPELDRLLSILSHEEKACMLLGYCYGYSHHEISDLVGMPLGTVKSVLRRSIIKIRETFGIEV